MKNVIWKKTNFGNFEVSNTGKVRNSNTKEEIKQTIGGSNDYYRVYLHYYDEGEKCLKITEVHNLVLKTFDPRDDYTGLVADHIKENDKLNNHIDNLQWLTKKENSAKAALLGTRRKPTHFTDEQRDAIIDIYKTCNYSMIKLTKYVNELFNTTASRHTITRIARGN